MLSAAQDSDRQEVSHFTSFVFPGRTVLKNYILINGINFAFLQHSFFPKGVELLLSKFCLQKKKPHSLKNSGRVHMYE